MVRLIARKLAESLVVVLLVVTATFVLIHAAPGDPFTQNVDITRTSPQARAQLLHNAGLDRPLHLQYFDYIRNLFSGDAGSSFAQSSPVASVIASRLGNTLLLASTALLLDFVIGISIGVWQAWKRGSRSDRFLTVLTLSLSSTPVFWLGLMFILLFSVTLGVFPVSGVRSVAIYDSLPILGKIWDRLRHLALPAATLALIGSGSTARFQRAAMIDTLGEDFIRTARAKGLSERAVVLKHALRNSLLPTITIFGLSIPVLLSGSVLVETVFSWPGMGHLAVQSVQSRDYYVVMAIAIISSVMVIAGNAVADILYRVADPRTREQE